MKTILILLFLFIIRFDTQFAVGFDTWFTSGVMRVDYVLAGDKSETNVYLSEIIFEPFWGGSETNLVDAFDYGDYKAEVRDLVSGELIYSRGFGSLFREWQTTAEAGKIKRAFKNSFRFPYPINSVTLEIFLRNKDQSLQSLFKTNIDPSASHIERRQASGFRTMKIVSNGPSPAKLDIVILPEGYTAREMKKFRKDARRLKDYFFTVEPFRSHKEKFNVHLVLSPGPYSGTDIPGEGIWKETILNSRFYTFGIERYLTSDDFWSICDIASNVPYDQIIILVNSDKYGGGGIYNFYSITSSDHPASPGVLVHEFGHSFAGLADEYYSSEVTYEEFYDLRAEPWEPNITTLKEFSRKWEDMLDKDVPVPTPAIEKYRDVTGVFEGGGYIAKGIYRPQMECRMKTNDGEEFCRVCIRAIERLIEFYTHE